VWAQRLQKFSCSCCLPYYLPELRGKLLNIKFTHSVRGNSEMICFYIDVENKLPRNAAGLIKLIHPHLNVLRLSYLIGSRQLREATP